MVCTEIFTPITGSETDGADPQQTSMPAGIRSVGQGCVLTESKNGRSMRSALSVGPQPGPASGTSPQPTHTCAQAHKGQGRSTSPSRGGDRADERGRYPCPAWELPSQGPWTHLGHVFQSPFWFRGSTGGSFACCGQDSIAHPCREDWNYCGLSFQTFFAFSVCFAPWCLCWRLDFLWKATLIRLIITLCQVTWEQYAHLRSERRAELMHPPGLKIRGRAGA